MDAPDHPSTQPSCTTDDDRWAAVRDRDRTADGWFVYSVRTTGVFCRPGCPSRLPRRGNVAFHDTAAKARSAGFRPCLRCRPEGERREQAQARTVAEAARAIGRSTSAPSLDTLARHAGLSPSHFQRVFKAATGVSPKQYAAAARADRLRGALTAEASVSDAVFAAGYEAPSRFYADAERRLGMRPSAFRRGGRGETIRVAVAESSLGAVLVAATERGVCAVDLGPDPDALLRAIQDRFPAAAMVGSTPAFDAVVASVVEAVEARAPAPELSLDVRGTAFQESVWRALRKIPPGETRTYADIARALGRPAAARAVAGACAANRAAVLIPCHRVVRTDGTLGGYRWGIDRKAEMLEREGRTSRRRSDRLG